MAYTVPKTQVAGTPILSADWNTYIRDNILFLANPPACRVYRSTNQSIPHITPTTAITFNSERFDTAAMHSTSVATSRITFPVAGLYMVGGAVRMEAASDYNQIALIINLTDTIDIAIQNTTDVDISLNPELSVSTLYKFAVNDWIELQIYQQNGAAAARNVLAAAAVSPEFWATWVGLG